MCPYLHGGQPSRGCVTVLRAGEGDKRLLGLSLASRDNLSGAEAAGDVHPSDRDKYLQLDQEEWSNVCQELVQRDERSPSPGQEGVSSAGHLSGVASQGLLFGSLGGVAV